MTDGAQSESETGRVMLDIETLGLEPGASIVAIGAVRFDSDGLGDTFQQSISLTSCEYAGLTIDAETLEWWLTQDELAKDQLTGGARLEDVLEDFAAWYGDADEIWANSPSFDCDILSAAYDAVDLDAPWSFYEERDFRTLASFEAAPEPEQAGVEHDALDDAVHQAEIASETLARLNEGELVTDGGEPEMKSIECPNCGMPFDVPEEADHWSCDCGASWELDPRTDGGHDLGVECDVDDCESRVVGLGDGWEVSRGTVCQDCLDYRDRHGHWPDEDPEICVECRLDEGAIRHRCDKAAADAVILNPDSTCDYCGFEANVATDGGRVEADGELARPPKIYDVVPLPDSERGRECTLWIGEGPTPCGNEATYLFVYEVSLDPSSDKRGNCLCCAECKPDPVDQKDSRSGEIVTDGGCVEADAEIVMMYDSGKEWSDIAERFDIPVEEAMERYRAEKYDHWDTGWELGPSDAQARFETGAIDVWGDGEATIQIEEIFDSIPLTLVAEDEEARTLVQANLSAEQARTLGETLLECADIREGEK